MKAAVNFEISPLEACFHKGLFRNFQAFAKQMLSRKATKLFEITTWTSHGCFPFLRCIALHLWLMVFTINNCLFWFVWLHFRVTPRMSWYLFQTSRFELCIRFSICSFQGTYLTEVYQSFTTSISSNLWITGKNQLYGTALPCWCRLTHPHHR